MDHISILFAERESLRAPLARTLTSKGFAISEVSDGENALAAIREQKPSMLLLGWELPDRNAIDLINELRNGTKATDAPIVVMTGNNAEDNRIRALESGADDCFSYQMSDRELITRLCVLLRRRVPVWVSNSEHSITAGRLTLNTDSRWLEVDGHTIDLSPSEFKLLHFLMSNPDRVHSRTYLLQQLCSDNPTVRPRAIDVQVRRIRMCLEPYNCDNYIQTSRGFGYRFSTKLRNGAAVSGERNWRTGSTKSKRHS